MATTSLEIGVGAPYSRSLGVNSGIGLWYNLSNRVDYIHLGNDGFGLPEFERFSEQWPLNDGGTDLGFVIRPRKIQLVLNISASSALEYWQLREKLLFIFKPRLFPILLKFTTPIRTYYIECFTEGGLTLPSTDKQANIGHKVAIQLVAPDPAFATPNITNLNIALSGNTNVTYSGTHYTYPSFAITGPFTTLSITYAWDSQVFGTLGKGTRNITLASSIAAGGALFIDTYPATRSVFDQSLQNAVDKITTSSDLVFPIYPTADITSFAGATYNRFSITSSGTSGASSVVAVYDDRHIGF